MYVRDLMTTEVVATTPDTTLKDAARLMLDNAVSGLPVLDGGRLVGMITEGDFLRQEADRDRTQRFTMLDALFGGGTPEPSVELVSQAMTDTVFTIGPDARLAEAARVMTKRNVKRLPVVDDAGKLLGVLSRADVVNAFTRPDEVIEDGIREDVVRRILAMDPDDLGITVVEGVVTLSGRVQNRTDSDLLEELSRRMEGVVRVENRLEVEIDERRTGTVYPIGGN